MSIPDDLTDAPIHVLAPLVASRQVSAGEIFQAHAARIEASDGKLGALADFWFDAAAQAARRADMLLGDGCYLGALHGIPLGLKDNLMVAGRSSAAGSAALAGRPDDRTATVADRLQKAGAVLLGKLHMVEFAAGAWGTNARLGTPWNPWHETIHHAPGGSSSGAGVAVAARLMPAAIGTDTGGSIRVPASFNGVVGLKPSNGAVSNYGVIPSSRRLDIVGPLCRSVEDAGLIHAAISGPDPLDADTAGFPWRDPLRRLKKPVRGMRVGMVAADQLPGVREDVYAAFQAAASAFEDLGIHVEEVSLPRSPAEYSRAAAIIIRSECYTNFAELIDGPGEALDPVIRARLRKGALTPVGDLVRALESRHPQRAQMQAFLSDYDAVILPTTPMTSVPLEEINEDDGSIVDLTRMANHLGLCALSIPCGFTESGLPHSLQIVGRPFEEERVLQLAWAYEQATPWHLRRSPFPPA